MLNWYSSSLLFVLLFCLCLGSPTGMNPGFVHDQFGVTNEPNFDFMDHGFDDMDMMPHEMGMQTEFPPMRDTPEPNADYFFPESWTKAPSQARRVAANARNSIAKPATESRNVEPSNVGRVMVNPPAFESKPKPDSGNFESPKNESKQINTSVQSQAAFEWLKQAINTVSTHAKEFISGIESVNEKTFKSMTELLKRNTDDEKLLNEFNAMLESWKLICSGSEEVAERFLHKMSLISSTDRSQGISERVLVEVKQYIQIYTNAIMKRHNSVMDVAFGVLNKETLRPIKINLLKQLVEHDNAIFKQSIRTINNYMELLTRLAKPVA